MADNDNNKDNNNDKCISALELDSKGRLVIKLIDSEVPPQVQ